jgi:hypothetical protein
MLARERFPLDEEGSSLRQDISEVGRSNPFLLRVSNLTAYFSSKK